MSINLGVPPVSYDLSILLHEFLRRAIDGTVPPLFVDYVNQRVIFNGTTISAAPAKVEVASGDIKVVSAGSGLILNNLGGTRYYRLTVDNDGALLCDPL